MISKVLINGEVSDGRIPVTDSSVLRGDGCFEVLKTYAGSVFALDDHLRRLANSAERMDLPIPHASTLAHWIEQVAADVPDGAIRVVVTRGSSVAGVEGDPLVIVFGHPWDRGQNATRLHPVVAPWHASGVDWALSGAKIISYAPNMSATRVAAGAGFDDALLISTDGLILEGPTFSLAWVIDGTIETPSLDLGILDSITRRQVLSLANEVGLGTSEGAWPLDRLDGAGEVMCWSTIREVQPVVAVGERSWAPGKVTAVLAKRFSALTG
jgi:branched-subunit amino acid aminotransferase/4-amino-4-deoxychorismate lyase